MGFKVGRRSRDRKQGGVSLYDEMMSSFTVIFFREMARQAGVQIHSQLISIFLQCCILVLFSNKIHFYRFWTWVSI